MSKRYRQTYLWLWLLLAIALAVVCGISFFDEARIGTESTVADRLFG